MAFDGVSLDISIEMGIGTGQAMRFEGVTSLVERNDFVSIKQPSLTDCGHITRVSVIHAVHMTVYAGACACILSVVCQQRFHCQL